MGVEEWGDKKAEEDWQHNEWVKNAIPNDGV